MKIPILLDPDYTVLVERVHGRKFIHCDVHSPWTRSIRERLRKEFHSWHHRISEPVYAIHYPEQGAKHTRFLGIFQFTQLAHVVDAEGRLCELWAKVTL